MEVLKRLNTPLYIFMFSKLNFNYIHCAILKQRSLYFKHFLLQIMVMKEKHIRQLHVQNGEKENFTFWPCDIHIHMVIKKTVTCLSLLLYCQIEQTSTRKATLGSYKCQSRFSSMKKAQLVSETIWHWTFFPIGVSVL